MMIAPTFVTVLILPFFAQASFAQNCARSYTVQAGDICDSISAQNNVSTYQLAVVNPGIDSNCDNLQPGQVLCLGNVGEDCSTTHVVVAGDTCEGVIQAAGINSTMFYGNNPQINSVCGNLYIGEVVCTANQILGPPLPGGSLPAATIPATATPAVVPPTPSPPVVPAGASPEPATPAPPAASPETVTPIPPASPSATPSSGPDSNLPFCDEL